MTFHGTLDEEAGTVIGSSGFPRKDLPPWLE